MRTRCVDSVTAYAVASTRLLPNGTSRQGLYRTACLSCGGCSDFKENWGEQKHCKLDLSPPFASIPLVFVLSPRLLFPRLLFPRFCFVFLLPRFFFSFFSSSFFTFLLPCFSSCFVSLFSRRIRSFLFGFIDFHYHAYTFTTERIYSMPYAFMPYFILCLPLFILKKGEYDYFISIVTKVAYAYKRKRHGIVEYSIIPNKKDVILISYV